MKIFKDNIVTITVAIIILLASAWALSRQSKKTSFSASKEAPVQLNNDNKKLTIQLEDLRVANLKLRAELDSCKFTIPKYKLPEVVISPKKKLYKYKVKVNYQTKYDSVTTLVSENRSKCADMEIKLIEEVSYKKKQIDTLIQVINAYDKQLNSTITELTNSNNRADSLREVINTPIAKEEALPCIKAKRGVMVDVYVDSTRVPKVKVVPYSKQEYKKLKGQCKKVTTR